MKTKIKDYILNRNKYLIYNISKILFKNKLQPVNNILLTGSPRSGTTWLGSLIASCSGIMVAREPFAPSKKLYRNGFSERTYRNELDTWKTGQSVINSFLEGRSFIPTSFADNQLLCCINPEQLILKCIRINRLLPWVAQNIDVQNIIYIVRHPCAVVNSQLAHKQFSPMRKVRNETIELIDQEVPYLKNYVLSLKNEEELRTVEWCMDQIIPLKSNCSKWITLSYEEIVLNGPNYLLKKLGKIKLDNNAITSNFNRNSKAVGEWSVDHSRASALERISSWQNGMEKSKITSVLNVVKQFGIKGFSSSPVPDFTNIKLEN